LKALRLFTTLFVVYFFYSNGFAQQKTNLEVIQELSRKSIDSLFSHGHSFLGDTLNVRMIPSTDSWIVENAILQKVYEHHRSRITSDSGTFSYPTLEFAISDMSIKYVKVFYDGFLGAKKVIRSVNLDLSSKITAQGALKAIDLLHQEYQDTVNYDSIPYLENGSIISTRSSLPEDTFIDRILSPLIVTSSVAVIVYLFFTLRK
jgi:hypothetical protein